MARLNFEGMKRIPANGWIAGVCAGIAEYFGWNVRLLRLILVVTFLVTGFASMLVVYGVLWYILEQGPPGSSIDATRSTPAPSGLPGTPPFAAATVPARGPTMTEVHARFARLDQRLRNIEECVTDREFELRRELKKLES